VITDYDEMCTRLGRFNVDHNWNLLPDDSESSLSVRQIKEFAIRKLLTHVLENGRKFKHGGLQTKVVICHSNPFDDCLALTACGTAMLKETCGSRKTACLIAFAINIIYVSEHRSEHRELSNKTKYEFINAKCLT